MGETFVKKVGFYLLLALPFLLFIFVFNFPAPPWPDAMVYDAVARDFLKTGIFRYMIWADFDPTYLHTNFNNGPLYPLIHIIFLKLFGSTDFRLIIGFNYLLAFLTFYNVGKILDLKSKRLLLLVILAFNPLVYHYTNVVRPEWFNIFIFTCIWRSLITRCYILAGILLALTAYSHQFAIFFVPCIIYSVCRREETWKARFVSLSIVALVTALFFLPYLYYIGSHWADFKLQLLGNQIEHGASDSALKFIKSFFVPLFYPSVGFFTQTGKISRWFADLIPVSVILCFVAFAVKMKRYINLSPITVEAGVFWFILNIGCAVETFNPYVTVPISIFAIALLKDVLSEITPRFVKVTAVAVLAALSYQCLFYYEISSKLFRTSDFIKASECISQKIPVGEKVYALAYPDPSTQLSNLRGDLDIRRFTDFEKYSSQWAEAVKTTNFFITSDDGYFLGRFDYDSLLRNAIKSGLFVETKCNVGNINLNLFSRE